jgi:hypothetical protein
MPVYEHDPASPILQKALRSSLPYSINLVYRTQHPNQTPNARILATFAPAASTVPACWAAAYIDRATRPATELWVFAAGEQPGHHEPSLAPASASASAHAFCPTCTTAVLALLDYMSTLAVPPLHPDEYPALELARQHEALHPESGPDVVYALSPGTYMRHLLCPGVVTLGACHHAVVQICRTAGVLRNEFPGADAELNKFVFKISDLPHTRDLPDGLRWGHMEEQHVPTVQARTSIPRAARTLLSLKSLAVYEQDSGRPVAWTFLGLDGSLTTLHTEPEYRGRGIAKTVAAKIISENAAGLATDDNGDAWSHADVYLDNVQSESVCKSLGGKAMWKHFWVRIDLSRAGSLASTGINGIESTA